MIEDIATLKKLIPTVVGTSIEKYRQPIADAQNWFAARIAGPALMSEIVRMGEDSEPGELFLRARLAVACKAYLTAIPKLDVLETNNGFAVVSDQTLAPASRDRVKALTDSFSSSLKDALGLFYEYVEDSPEYRPVWLTAPGCTIMTDSYLPTLREFRKYGAWTGGYESFVNLQADVRAVILKFIEPKISRALSDKIVSEIQRDALSDANARIVGDLRYALAGYYRGDRALGYASLCRVREVLEESPDDYPEFRDSDIYRRLVASRENQKKTSSILPII